MTQKELTPKQIMDSRSYSIQKSIINRETNTNIFPDYNTENPFPFAPTRLAEPRRIYQFDQKVFKKEPEERVLLANLKHKWRKEIQNQGYTKKKVPTGVNGTVIMEK